MIEDLQIEHDFVTQVTISQPNGNFYDSFFLVGDSRIIYSIDGAFFEFVKSEVLSHPETSYGNESVPTATSATNEQAQIFYGNWVATKVLAYGPVLTDEDETKFIGTKIAFFAESVSWDGEIYDKPEYTVTLVSDYDFYLLNLVPIKELGIEDAYISQVDVATPERSLVFFIKDAETLITIHSAVYYELKKG